MKFAVEVVVVVVMAILTLGDVFEMDNNDVENVLIIKK
jgi:hypothetical protein